MKSSNILRGFVGELLGTFILVLFGCGSVAVSTLFGEYYGIFQIAIVWGLGVSLAIYLTRHICCAHLNPAVSIAMVVGKRMKASKLPSYLVAQFLGAFIAGAMLYVLFSPSIVEYETVHGIVRGAVGSEATGRMFGEYYIKHGCAICDMSYAILGEGFGTFLLVLLIFALTEGCNVGRPNSSIAPLFIGISVSSVICLVAPLTQAGLNPARDFGPRMIAWIAGWGSAAFPDNMGGFFWVYILSPIVGGTLAALLFVCVLEPMMNKETREKKCCDDK